MQITAGVGFKPEHYEEALASPADGLWFEVHAENYMIDGGPRLAMLEMLRAARPLSVHGVGLSLAGSDEPDPEHLSNLWHLIQRFEPALVSEHLAWSRFEDACFSDLLPFPRTGEMLEIICRNIEITQDALKRPISIENPSLYMNLKGHEWSETDFLSELVRRTGCGLLVDANNIYVSANNLRFAPLDYVDALPVLDVTEIHLAGHSTDPQIGTSLLIDSHDQPISEIVWKLYEQLLERTGPTPTLVERDGNIPPFAELMSERDRAAAILAREVEHA